MNPHQRRRSVHLAHYQRHRIFRISIRHRIKPEPIDSKLPPAGREISRSQLFRRRAHIFIIEGEEVLSD